MCSFLQYLAAATRPTMSAACASRASEKRSFGLLFGAAAGLDQASEFGLRLYIADTQMARICRSRNFPSLQGCTTNLTGCPVAPISRAKSAPGGMNTGRYAPQVRRAAHVKLQQTLAARNPDHIIRGRSWGQQMHTPVLSFGTLRKLSASSACSHSLHAPFIKKTRFSAIFITQFGKV